MEKISAIRGLAAILMACFWLLPSVGNADPHKLTCGKEKTIGEALHELKPGDTLLVSGICNENVEILEEVHRITLDGQGTATIIGPDATRDSVQIRASGVTIRGFTITGGRHGIQVHRGVAAIIDNNTVQNTGRDGIAVNESSYAEITNITVQNNPFAGIAIRNNSGGRIGFSGPPDARVPKPNTIHGNGSAGINVDRSSEAQIGYNVISNNKDRGIAVRDSSHAGIGGLSDTGPNDNTVSGNGGDGIRVSDSSQAQIAGNTITNNTGHGVFVNLNSSAAIFSDIGPTPNTIQQNGLVTARRDGVQVTSSSSAFISGNTISNNTGHGVRVVRTSHASIGGNAINNSGLDGIRRVLGGKVSPGR